MMKHIRTLGAAVVALAAPVLLAAPAAADTRLTVSIGAAPANVSYRSSGPDYRRGLNQWGQTDREVRDLTRDAVQSCRQAVRYEARRIGYRDIDFDRDERVRQVGPRGFLVTFDEVEFEGRHRDHETRVTCEIRRSDVVSIEGIPRPGKGKAPHRGW